LVVLLLAFPMLAQEAQAELVRRLRVCRTRARGPLACPSAACPSAASPSAARSPPSTRLAPLACLPGLPPGPARRDADLREPAGGFYSSVPVSSALNGAWFSSAARMVPPAALPMKVGSRKRIV
jgi:hypothetical protein